MNDRAAEANRLERGVVLPELLEAHQRGHEPRVVRAAHCDDALVFGERAGRVAEVRATRQEMNYTVLNKYM